MTVLVVFCTCPDEASAARIAHVLVEERLAACVNRLPGVCSTYRWEGAVQEGVEVLLLIKSTETRFEALRERVLALHPYELPELIAVKVAAGMEPYLRWVATETIASADIGASNPSP